MNNLQFSKSLKRGLLGFGAGFFMWGLFCLFVGIAGLWVAGSVITSGVKAGTDNCGQTYVVEHVLAGDWFCQEK